MIAEREIPQDMDHDFWKGKLEEIGKACSGSATGALPLPSRGKGFADAAAMIVEALRKKIPAKSVETGEAMDRGDGLGCFKVSIRFKGFFSRLDLECSCWKQFDRNQSRYVKVPAAKASYLFRGWPVHTVDLHDCGVESIVGQFVRFYGNYVGYREELRLLFKKREKSKQLATAAIHAAVPKLMAQAGCEWHLEEGWREDHLLVKMPRGRMLDIVLDCENHLDRLRDLVQVAVQEQRLIDALPYPVDVKGSDDRWSWNKPAGNS